jgi:hypothetical protein
MERDHKAVNEKALALVKKLGVTPEDNDTSKALSKQAADKRAELAKLNGKAFDKAYIDNEVAYHKAVNSRSRPRGDNGARRGHSDQDGKARLHPGASHRACGRYDRVGQFGFRRTHGYCAQWFLGRFDSGQR